MRPLTIHLRAAFPELDGFEPEHADALLWRADTNSTFSQYLFQFLALAVGATCAVGTLILAIPLLDALDRHLRLSNASFLIASGLTGIVPGLGVAISILVLKDRLFHRRVRRLLTQDHVLERCAACGGRSVILLQQPHEPRCPLCGILRNPRVPSPSTGPNPPAPLTKNVMP